MSKLPCPVNKAEPSRSSAGDLLSLLAQDLLLPPPKSDYCDGDVVAARRSLRIASASDISLASAAQKENDRTEDTRAVLCGPGDVGVSHLGYDPAYKEIVPHYASAAAASISSGQFSTLVNDRAGCANDDNATSNEGVASDMHRPLGYDGDHLCAVDRDCRAVVDCGNIEWGTRKTSKWDGESWCQGEMTATAPQVGASCSSISKVLYGDVQSRDCLEPPRVATAACCEHANVKQCENSKYAGRKKDDNAESENDNEQGIGWQPPAVQADEIYLTTAGATATPEYAATDWPLGNLEDTFSQDAGLKGFRFSQCLDKRVNESAKKARQHRKAVSPSIWPESCSLLPSRASWIPDTVVQKKTKQLLARSWPPLERLDRQHAALRAVSAPELDSLQYFLESSSSGRDGGIELQEFGLELEDLALPPMPPLSARSPQLSQPLPHYQAMERPPEVFEAEIWKFVQNMQAYRDLVSSGVESQGTEPGDSQPCVHANVKLLPQQEGGIGGSCCQHCHVSTSSGSASVLRNTCTTAAVQVGAVGSDGCCSSTDNNNGGSCVNEGGSSKSDGIGDTLLLPDELWLHVFSYFSPIELCRGPAVVCRRWHRLCADASLWMTLEFALGSPIAPHKLCYVASRAPRLSVLSLQGREQLLPTELAVIGQLCPNLVELDLGFCNVGLAALHTMTNCGGYRFLNTINVEGSGNVNMDFVQLLCSLPSLTAINLSHCHVITDLEMIYLAQHVGALTKLNADGLSFITDEAVEELVRCHGQRLTSLHLDGADLTDCSLRIVSWSCPRLEHLRVSFCEQLTDESLQNVQNLTSLKSLGLRKGSLFSSMALQRMFGCDFRMSQLLYLDLSECTGLDDVALQGLACCCPRLTELHLRWCWEVSEAGLEAVVTKCRALRVLDLLGIDKITGNCFRDLPSLLPALRQLDLSQCNRILDEIIQDVVKRVPSVQVKNYYGELFKA